MNIRYTSHLSEFMSDHKKKKAICLEVLGGTAEGHAKDNLTKNKSVINDILRGGITHQTVSEDTVAIGTHTKYAPYVEMGHHQEPGRYVPAIGKRLVASFVKGKPYLKPALDDHHPEYYEITEKIMKVD